MQDGVQAGEIVSKWAHFGWKSKSGRFLEPRVVKHTQIFRLRLLKAERNSYDVVGLTGSGRL